MQVEMLNAYITAHTGYVARGVVHSFFDRRIVRNCGRKEDLGKGFDLEICSVRTDW